MPSYEDALDEFEGLNTQVLGISVDSVPSHNAWEKSVGGITYPLLSDFYPHGEVAKKYGVLRENKDEPAYGASERALFVIDKEGIIRFIDVHPIGEQPENEEIFEVLKEIENK